ncbi:MAG: hypothetical protein GXO79_06875 [Chlorobi bacterium]|nr:hypothetical protein [Chlorobiota bacterium]
MKQIINKLRNKYNRIITLFISLLGFSTACIQTACEYGSPSADFIINGIVQSEDSSQVIPNIKVVSGYDSTYSDYEGKYLLNIESFPNNQTFLLKFTDIDKQENRQFETLDTLVEFTDPVFSGGDRNWYSGETKKVLNIKLKPKD